jgi:superfamily II DNA or RNA helicase
LIIVDEAHHGVMASYLAILAKHPHAAVVGATATPFRADGQGLAPLFSSLLRGPSVRSLVDDGFLVPARVLRAAAQVNTDELDTNAMTRDFDSTPLAKRAMVITGDVIKEFQRLAGSPRTLVYAVNVKHSLDLTAKFMAAGYFAEHIEAKTPRQQRAATMERFRSGATQVLVNVEIVTEGFDVPEVEVIVLVRPTQSRALHVQMMGRGLRIAPGKVRRRLTFAALAVTHATQRTHVLSARRSAWCWTMRATRCVTACQRSSGATRSLAWARRRRCRRQHCRRPSAMAFAVRSR